MTRMQPDIIVRPSRAQPGKFVLCSAETGVALTRPCACRLRDKPACVACIDASYFDTEADALAALERWRDIEPKRSGVPASQPRVSTLADELRALRAWMRKRAVDPWHGWHPSTSIVHASNGRVVYSPSPPAFRTPSAELRAMQAGKPAYGRSVSARSS